MTTFNWTINQCDSLSADGFITTAHWTASATDASMDKDFNASVYSTCSFTGDVASIPYADVTEAQVLNWCWSNGVDKEATEAALVAQIEAKKNPVTASGKPWSK